MEKACDDGNATECFTLSGMKTTQYELIKSFEKAAQIFIAYVMDKLGVVIILEFLHYNEKIVCDEQKAESCHNYKN